MSTDLALYADRIDEYGNQRNRKRRLGGGGAEAFHRVRSRRDRVPTALGADRPARSDSERRGICPSPTRPVCASRVPIRCKAWQARRNAPAGARALAVLCSFGTPAGALPFKSVRAMPQANTRHTA